MNGCAADRIRYTVARTVSANLANMHAVRALVIEIDVSSVSKPVAHTQSRIRRGLTTIMGNMDSTRDRTTGLGVSGKSEP